MKKASSYAIRGGSIRQGQVNRREWSANICISRVAPNRINTVTVNGLGKGSSPRVAANRAMQDALRAIEGLA